MIALETLEKSRRDLQRRLDATKTQAERNRLGQFATPPELAFEIVTEAVSMLPHWSKVRLLEPGFGTGPFYSALLRHVPQSLIEAAAGYEIDPHYAEPARSLWEHMGLKLHIADFTKVEPPKSESAKFNLVVCNPPYVRHHHLGQVQKQELQARVLRYTNFRMNGLGGLYTYFILMSQAWMQKGGLGAWLIPSEFMDVNYGRKVKEFLVEKMTLCRIHRFDPKEVQFGDALVSSAVVFFKNSPPSPNQEIGFTFGGTLERPKVRGSIAISELRHIPKWTSIPQEISHLSGSYNNVRLTDLFTIKRGLATGCNSFFVLTPEQTTRLCLPKKFLQPILPSPRQLHNDIIFADKDGEPQIQSRRYLLSCDLSEIEVRTKYPTLWEYLQLGIKKGVHKRYLCRNRDPWYSQEKRPPAPFLCTYMGRQKLGNECPFRFILNYSKATAANVYLLLYPKPIVAASIDSNPESCRAIWKVLSSITCKVLLREGRVYGGGLHKLEPKELANVPADLILEILPNAKDVSKGTQMRLFGGLT